MRWHLCNPLGVSERTTEADSEFWAKRRFVPIPKGWFVCSDASYQVGWRMPEVVEVCAKCFRNPPAPGNKKCETCRKRDRQSSNSANAKKSARYGKNAVSETRASTLRKRYREETPEEKEARRERMRVAAHARMVRINTKNGRKAIQQNILKGIEHRRAKREAQLSLFGA